MTTPTTPPTGNVRTIGQPWRPATLEERRELLTADVDPGHRIADLTRGVGHSCTLDAELEGYAAALRELVVDSYAGAVRLNRGGSPFGPTLAEARGVANGLASSWAMLTGQTLEAVHEWLEDEVTARRERELGKTD